MKQNAELQTAVSKIESNEDDQWEFDRLVNKIVETNVRDLSNVKIDLFTRPLELMEFILKYRNEGFLKHLYDYLENMKHEYSDMARSRKLAQKNVQIDDPDLYYGIDKEKADIFRNVILGFLNIHKGIVDLHTSLEKRLREDERWKKHKASDRNIPSEAQEVETLYHVSINAHVIAQTGFIEGFKKDSSMGLGGAGHDEGLISFTHDLKAARNLARTFKDVVYIAHGQLTAANIIEWFKTDGLEEELKQFFQEYRRKAFKPDDPHHVFLLFNYYLWHNKLRMNPLFMNTDKSLIDNFKTKSIQDIGIIVAKVNVKHPKVQYLKHETEIRAPVDAVLSIEKVL